MNVKGAMSHPMEVGSDPLGNITRINNVLEAMPSQLEEAQMKLSNVKHQLETAKAEVDKPFPQEAELAEKLERLAELNSLLNMDEKGDDAIGMDDEAAEPEKPQETVKTVDNKRDEVADMPAKQSNLGKTAMGGKLSDRPAERTSLQEKLAAMKARVSGTPAGTGTLETYLPEVETYLQEKAQQEQINNQLVTQGRELVQEQNALVSEGKVLSELEKEPVIEPETVHITFTVAECGEIHSMGEFHEGIETVEEAMKLYNAIDPSRMQGIPSIGVNMHIEGTEEWEDEQADIVSGKRIDVDFLNYTPELRDTPKVQDALKKLIAAFPEKEVNDRETKDQKIQALAAELDQLSYDIDTFEYRDSVPDREAQIQMIANDIRSGNVKPLQIFLQTSIDEGIDEDSERQAKELLVKLADYKPLAKIEELEEQNYNMIDNVLNNGVEKFNREEEKKEQQEKPQARSSLKERLATKQKEAAHGNNKDTKEQEKSKNSHREM